MSEGDLIRRGDVENALRTDLRDDDATRLASAWALNRLRALPANQRAAAAIRLAEALFVRERSFHDSMEYYEAAAAWLEIAEPAPQPRPARDATDTLRELRKCAASWEPAATLLGNVTAGEIVRALDAVLRPAPEKKPGGAICCNPRCSYMVGSGDVICTKCGFAQPRTAPRPCDACGTFDGRIERMEGDHLGATVWHERCPTCQPYPVTP